MNNKYFSNSAQAVFFLALPLIGACSFAGQMAKESVEGATSYYSREHFTLTATVPAKFGFTSKAQYSPKQDETCQVYSSGLGGSVTRQQQKSNTVDAKDIEQTVSTDIPLEFKIAGCSMELSRVSYEVTATYGPDDWDHGLEMAGGLSINTESTGNASASYTDLIEQRGLCAWSFQISTAKAKKDQIEKLLSCSAADPNWKVSENRLQRRKPGGALSRNAIANKTIHVTFKLSNDETPSYLRYWVKVPNGWKPCTGRWNSGREELCTTPPQFRTFKQNGRECSVYPGCTE
ncbi:hypothetical protein ACIQVE_04095 [Pseudomonas sp. NPDC098747]|uniref:hypothetical protein n=1 Tax=Pseudomonas sp. NPDC098747 TaxID=3364487 RepID=UPI00383BF642